MYATQCVVFEGCRFITPISLENGPSFKYIPTSSREKYERLLKILIFDGGLFLKFYLWKKSLNNMIHFPKVGLRRITNIKSFKSLSALGKLSNNLLS